MIAQTEPLPQGKDGKAALPAEDDTRFVLAHQKGFNKQSFEQRIAGCVDPARRVRLALASTSSRSSSASRS